jgi:hypothetical protein
MERRVGNLLCSSILFGAFHAEEQTSKLQGYWLEPSGKSAGWISPSRGQGHPNSL